MIAVAVAKLMMMVIGAFGIFLSTLALSSISGLWSLSGEPMIEK